MRQRRKERPKNRCIVIRLPLWATGAHSTGNSDDCVEHTPELFPRGVRKTKYLSIIPHWHFCPSLCEGSKHSSGQRMASGRERPEAASVNRNYL